MGHLNELAEKYGDKGLQVIAITNEPRGLVDKFIEETGATHPIVIESSDSASTWDIKGFPTCFVIAADGTIAAVGMPNDGMIEELLKDARLFPEVPKSLDGVVKKLEKEDFKSAIAMLEKFMASEGNSEEETAAAGELKAWIDWRATNGMQGAQKATESGDFYRAATSYAELAKLFKGTEVADEAEKALVELLSDKDRKREVDAGEQLAKARERAADMSDKKAVKLYEAIAKKFDGTKAGEQARVLAIKLANK